MRSFESRRSLLLVTLSAAVTACSGSIEQDEELGNGSAEDALWFGVIPPFQPADPRATRPKPTDGQERCTAGEPQSGTLYYTAGGLAGPVQGQGPSIIGSMRLDGSDQKLLSTDQVRVRGIAVDEHSGTLFWNDAQKYSTFRSNLDGTEVEVVVDWLRHFGSAHGVTDIDVDPVRQRIYVGVAFSFSQLHGVLSANYDGSDVQVVYDGFPDAWGESSWFIDGVDYDERTQNLYLTDPASSSSEHRGIFFIPSASPGAEPVSLIPHLDGMGHGVQVDVEHGHLFFAHYTEDGTGEAGLWRADFAPGFAPTSADDIRSVTKLIDADIGTPRDVALVPSERHVYWVDESRGTIERVAYNGTERTVIAADLDAPDSLYIALELDADGDGVGDTCDLCANTIADTPSRLEEDRWALLDPASHEFDTHARVGKKAEQSYSTFDTGGCSCAQIAGTLRAGSRQLELGCSTYVMDLWLRMLDGETDAPRTRWRRRDRRPFGR